MGTNISLPDTNWTANGRTLIFALSTDCYFCKESISFYKDLLPSARAANLHTVAVFRQSVNEGRSYLASAGLDIKDVRQRELETLGIAGTPTLIVADQTGHIVSAWVGKLAKPQEEEVFQSLGLKRTPANPGFTPVATQKVAPNASGAISPAQLRAILRVNPEYPIIDIRNRNDYKQGHLAGSVNVPFDELEERAPHEVPANQPVAIYCHYCPPCEAQKASQGSMSLCTVAATVLRFGGFTNFQFVGDDLKHLKLAGLPINGDSHER
ncbi:MAG TPA: rhodanese-like domain-containing protein [Candidatus Angelobacter sp.]|nr:rhodanese-like domain-containing protein [Candidatus Angelobacter sp.]